MPDNDPQESLAIETEQSIGNFKAEFKEHDKEADGGLTLAEFLPELDSHEMPGMSDEEQTMHEDSMKLTTKGEELRFKNSDTNKDGKLDYKEFVYARMKSMHDVDAMFHEYMQGHTKSEMARLLEQHDGDSDGHLSLSEFTHPDAEHLRDMTHPEGMQHFEL